MDEQSAPAAEPATPPHGSNRRSGRRPGDSDARAAIASAARELFASTGFERTTIREVAARAKVDPALVMYYFSNKRTLFAEVLALPAAGPLALSDIHPGDREALADRLVDSVLALLDDAEPRSRFEAVLRAAVSDPSSAEVLREVLAERFHAPIAAALGGRDARLRSSLIGSAIVGLIVSRGIVATEPLASATPAQLRRILRPVFGQYLSAGT